MIKGICNGLIRISARYFGIQGGSGSTIAQAGDQDIKIVLGQQLVHTPYKSLFGKTLPDMSDIGIKLEEVEDKAILVCFFDYEQRPSRNCITQLNARAQELKDKSIEVIVIQASSIDENALNGWIKEQNITFPIGIIEENPSTSLGTGEEEVRFNWGIESLPWLILTDTEHVVTAEGFSISDLDAEIEN